MRLALPVISVVGRGGSGRTTLLEALIAELVGRGYRVATAKHHAHETDIDVPGKDTWRHANAGAKLTMVSAPNRLGSFRGVDREKTLEELAELAGDFDLLLTEGFKQSSPVLIEVVRSARSSQPICSPDELFAMVTDVPGLGTPGLITFELGDAGGLADLIVQRFLAGRKRRPPQSATQVVYMDHGATSWPKPRPVIDAVLRAMTELGANPGRGAHAMALSIARAVFEARRACAELLGVKSPRDLIFQPGCTAACNLMLAGVLTAGDRVVVGSMEHNAIARPLARLAASGVEVVVVKADDTGLLDPGDVEREVRAARTRAVVCQHASNVSGTIQLIGELAEAAHENGALLLVDGAQAAGYLDVDLTSIGADAYAVSGHKGMLGPLGVGLLYLSSDLDVTEQIVGGAGGGDSSSLSMPEERPERYEAGTLNTPGIMGLGAAAAMLLADGPEMREREAELIGRLHRGIVALGGFRVLGPPPGLPRVPILSLVHEEVDPDRLAFLLDCEHGIAARAGLHCSPWAHESLGTAAGGALRLCVGWRTTEEEIDLVLLALERITGAGR